MFGPSVEDGGSRLGPMRNIGRQWSVDNNLERTIPCATSTPALEPWITRRFARRWPTSHSPCALTDTDEIKAVIAAVNEGIDSHLEACYCPDRGDRYEGGKRKAGKLVLCVEHPWSCRRSVRSRSLPRLLLPTDLCESDLAANADVQGRRKSACLPTLLDGAWHQRTRRSYRLDREVVGMQGNNEEDQYHENRSTVQHPVGHRW